MSIATRAKTRPRALAIAAYLLAHPDFASLAAVSKLAAIYNPSPDGKGSLDDRLEAQCAKIEGILITITPAGGNNKAGDTTKVGNETVFAVNVWFWPHAADDTLPEPIDFIDEVQRVLQGFAPPHADGSKRHSGEAVKVSSWVQVPDKTYLNLEVKIATLILL